VKSAGIGDQKTGKAKAGASKGKSGNKAQAGGKKPVAKKAGGKK
jgi:hypothetical protein